MIYFSQFVFSDSNYTLCSMPLQKCVILETGYRVFFHESRCLIAFWKGNDINWNDLPTTPMMISSLTDQHSDSQSNFVLALLLVKYDTKETAVINSGTGITWCDAREILYTQLTLCVGNPPVIGGFPLQRASKLKIKIHKTEVFFKSLGLANGPNFKYSI